MVGYLSKKAKYFGDDPGKRYRQRIRATQAKGWETLDPKVEVEGPSESPRESPPLSPKEDQPQPPPMREQPQPERKIELCTPDVVDLPIINLQDAGRPFKIKVTTIHMVQHSLLTGKEDRNLHLQEFVQLCQIFDEDEVTQDQMRARLFSVLTTWKSFALVSHFTGGVKTRLGSVDEVLYEGILFAYQDPEFAQLD
jgi:hypothetical protein